MCVCEEIWPGLCDLEYKRAWKIPRGMKSWDSIGRIICPLERVLKKAAMHPLSKDAQKSGMRLFSLGGKKRFLPRKLRQCLHITNTANENKMHFYNPVLMPVICKYISKGFQYLLRPYYTLPLHMPWLQPMKPPVPSAPFSGCFSSGKITLEGKPKPFLPLAYDLNWPLPCLGTLVLQCLVWPPMSGGKMPSLVSHSSEKSN